jgi:hypothetical protein
MTMAVGLIVLAATGMTMAVGLIVLTATGTMMVVDLIVLAATGMTMAVDLMSWIGAPSCSARATGSAPLPDPGVIPPLTAH